MAEGFVEVVVEGPRGWDLGFIQGFFRARGAKGAVLDAEYEGFDCSGFREKLAELLHPGRERLHLIVPESLEALLAEAVAASGEGPHPLSIVARRPIGGAAFSFSFRIFSREVGERVKDLLLHPPEGVLVEWSGPLEERIDPRARGTELYAPSHDYELRGEGACTGSLEAVLALHQRLKREEPVHLRRLELLEA
ncbi:MAG: hypothetical protein ACP5VN_00745 [Acidobacteriota bacterium]